MKSFEQLQADKAERAEKLLQILPAFAAPELHSNLDSSLLSLASNLKYLLARIKEQRDSSSNEQLNTLLDQEIDALQRRNKDLGTNVILHIERASKGAELNLSPVREALIMIASRKESLNSL